ncbi:glycine--tRNA ligase [candidate division WWE3 bacterium]|nr:glycine--tRNA ligase [candidate division WWE3 bacterium]
MKDIVSLCKRRGFIFPGSEIYGGLANTYDLGPLGVEMLRNIVDSWWEFFVHQREEIYGLDTSILMSPRVWEASGHTESFNDLLVDCKNCQLRTRADHIIEDYLTKNGKSEKVEGRSAKELDTLINKYKIECPECGEFDWTPARAFNLLFKTHIGIIPGEKSTAYLRGEIAQGMFVNFKNVLDTMHPKLPFGLAQFGKAFRNEITLGNYIFRTLEFNLAEFEYFFDPNEQDWMEYFKFWKEQMVKWIVGLGVNEDHLRWRVHTDDERSHYSERTEDLDFRFPMGYKEMFGLAYRTDFDLRNHMEKSGVDMTYTNHKTGEKIIPHVVEPTFGINRVLFALLTDAYNEDGKRTVLELAPEIAPYKFAVFPLVRNKPEIVEKAREVFKHLNKDYNVAWDDRGNIGKRYLSQDEIGTPYCVTIDYDTLEDDTVTVRDRDTTEQERVPFRDIAI